MENTNEKGFVIKTYTQKELAGFYGVTAKTFRKWLKRAKVDLGIRLGNYYSPQQVRTIVSRIGYPFIWFASVIVQALLGADDGGEDAPEQVRGDSLGKR